VITEVLFKVVYQEPPALGAVAPTVPTHVIAAVERAMAKSADARFPDIDGFIAALTGRPLAPAAPAAEPMVDGTVASGALAPAPTPAARASSAPASLDATAISASGAVPLDATAISASGAVPLDATAISASGAVPAPRPRTKRWPLVMLGCAVAAVGVFAGARHWLAPAAPAEAPPPAPSQVQTPPKPQVAVPVPTPAVGPRAPVPAPQVPPPDTKVHPVPPQAQAHGGQAEPVHAKPAPQEPLPPGVQADLASAKRALEAGDARLALHLAQRSLRTKRTWQAFALMTLAYCHDGALGDARSAMRMVPARERREVVARCLKDDVDLR